jgi:hypothetical protein
VIFLKPLSQATVDISFLFLLLLTMPISVSGQLLSHPLNNNTNSGKNATISISTSKSLTTPISADKFGIKKIYPTKVGGREWFINMANPSNDSIFSVGDSSHQNITRQTDGSWHILYPKVRMEVATPLGSALWKNVEITGYIKVNSIIPHDHNNDANYTDIAWLARSGRHSDSTRCDGTALIGGIHDDGTVGWKKEIWFTGGYTKELSQSQPTNSIVGKWIGWKVVIYNINNNTAVKMESYLDYKNNNHWVKVTDILDDGGWFADATDGEFYSANCGRAKDYILTNGGPNVTFRSDNLALDFKDLSVREIRPPTDR